MLSAPPPPPRLVAEIAAAVAARPSRRRTGVNESRQPQPKQLLRAAKDGDAASVARLLDAGLDIEHRGMWGNNPLLCACAYGSDAVASLLIQRGANVAVENEDGATALMLGCLEGLQTAVGLMLDSGTLPSLWPPAVIVYNKDTDSSSPQTPLRAACENGHCEVLRALLDHVPESGGILDTAPEGAVAEAVVAAAKHGHTATLEMLYDFGVPVTSCVNAAGKTAMDVAVVEVADLLQALGRREARMLAASRKGCNDNDDQNMEGMVQPDSARHPEPATSTSFAPEVLVSAVPPAAVPRPPPNTTHSMNLRGPIRGARQLKPLNVASSTVTQDASASHGFLPLPPAAVR
eukprot:SAG31_NODE_2427_length_5717_cov_3.956671_2_plen_348_part_00